MPVSRTVPVIDIFAGPGGLGEGFSAFNPESGGPSFKVALSIEKDAYAHETLRLRSFFRQFRTEDVPELYYQVLRQKLPLQTLPERLKEISSDLYKRWQAAEHEALHAELGASDSQNLGISKRIREAIGEVKKPWVLIGGPPCQAYSVVGRVRNQGNASYRIEDDHRSSLYRQYLRIIADHWPAVFVMENVKGLLSAVVNKIKVFDAIIGDLQSPKSAFGEKKRSTPSQRYRIVPVVSTGAPLLKEMYQPTDFIVACEQYGVPQVRHRVILIGIREDLGDVDLSPLSKERAPTVNEVIGDLPRLRSGLSRKREGEKYVPLSDGAQQWIETINGQTLVNGSNHNSRWLKTLGDGDDTRIYDEIHKVVSALDVPADDRGGNFVKSGKTPSKKNPLGWWYEDKRLQGVCNHETRAHMDSDLARYLFAACYARTHGISPRLSEFPVELQPDHDNAASGDFDDRFRVQVAGLPSTTITSHISKDGHYFIHPDATQCRSLTVREAARLQTFPDNYNFCGPRTSQCVQVGNAVPPYLAYQIARSVSSLLWKAGKLNSWSTG